MCQNNTNAIIVSGHSSGVVNMWTSNFSEPVVKILAHPNTISTFAVDGNNLITCGNDSKMRVWDLRTNKQIYDYFNPMTASFINTSQKGLLAVAYGNKVEVWKDYSKSKQKEPEPQIMRAVFVE